ncbi:hypothetical protein C0995_007950 [Termitomyces sp. Mi166|nr:hypothetical protein C0995_007950 [Termitomyces sp. Mi166\
MDIERPVLRSLNNDKRLPLLVWVDDRPENNIEEVRFAREANVYVLEFSSTALLKAWMEENEGWNRPGIFDHLIDCFRQIS